MGDGKKDAESPKAGKAGQGAAQEVTQDFDAIVGEARSALGVLAGLQDALGTQIAALEKRDSETKSALSRLNADAEQLKKDRSGLVSERATVVKEKQALEVRAADLDSLESTVAKQLSALEKQQAESAADLEKVTQEQTKLDEARESVESLRAEFEADYGSSAEFAQKLEAREKALIEKEAAVAQKEADIAKATAEIEAARAEVEAQTEKNAKCEEALRLREESVNQFREMLTVMRNGIDDPNGNIGEVVANAAAAERAAIAATESAKSQSGVDQFSAEELAAARIEFEDSGSTDEEIALRLHARRTLGGAGSTSSASRWKLPWSK